jgi:hypothetical protein
LKIISSSSIIKPNAMKPEFMLYIRNAGDAKAALSPEAHLAFIKKCETFIGQLQSQDKLIAAQPLVREGFIISKNEDEWNTIPVDASKKCR